ncbi:MAG: transketolase [Pseudomonadota bacterium]
MSAEDALIDLGVEPKKLADALRVLAMDAVQAANSGHPGMPMGMADVATVLWSRFLKFNPAAPNWPDRDRFILSAGHGSMLLYGLLHLTGFEDMTLDELRNFRQLDARTAGHPEFGHATGIETTTGPLGQGLANGVGMALAERLIAARVGQDVCDHYTYVIAGDGCLMEGISHEAISLAGHLKLHKLIVLWDDNAISIDGATDLSVSDDQLARFEASGWEARRVDGHDHEAVAAAIAAARETECPSLIACKTQIGFGSPKKAGTAAAHGAPLGPEEIAATREALGWTHAAFDMPGEVAAAWRAVGARSQEAHAAWTERSAQLEPEKTQWLGDPVAACADQVADAIAGIKATFRADEPKLATRQSSQKVIEALVPALPGMIGGSADLSGSNGTRTGHHVSITPEDFSGNYMHYGVREHGMAAAMNGMALHGGVVPYGGTFLVFTDYCRPAIRLSALMGQRVIYVMTHDSIGLGEDGPTHQPVEHLAAMRAMPNVNVFRPADAMECAECWQLALAADKTPSILALTRQGLPMLPAAADPAQNRSAQGAYVVREASGERAVTLIASGSEVELALAAADELESAGVAAAVVSMPCMELFKAQTQAVQDEVLGTAPRLAIEAGVAQGWHEWLGANGAFIGVETFGLSGPYKEVYARFGLTPGNIAQTARGLL